MRPAGRGMHAERGGAGASPADEGQRASGCGEVGCGWLQTVKRRPLKVPVTGEGRLSSAWRAHKGRGACLARAMSHSDGVPCGGSRGSSQRASVVTQPGSQPHCKRHCSRASWLMTVSIRGISPDHSGRYPDHSSVRSQISMRVRQVTRATGPQPPSMWSPQRACKASSIDVNQN